jgi:GAF domain-containing protein
VPRQQLMSVVREFASTIVNPYDLAELLQRLTDVVSELTGARGAGIMLAGRPDGSLGFAAASEDAVVDVEVTQERISGGPCHEAFFVNELRVVEDLQESHRWPEYERRALELGFRSVLGVPMNAWGQTIGVVNVYRDTPGPWEDHDIEAAEVVTAMGAAYILHADQLRAQHELAGQLQTALAGRDIIGQAKGILMARHGIDADAAFDKLRTVSQNANIKLREVARRLVEAEDGASPSPVR